MTRLEMIRQNVRDGRKIADTEMDWLIDSLEDMLDEVVDLQKKNAWTEHDRDIWRARYEMLDAERNAEQVPHARHFKYAVG